MFPRNPMQMLQGQPNPPAEAFLGAINEREALHASDVPQVTDQDNPYWQTQGVPQGQLDANSLGQGGGLGGPGQSPMPQDADKMAQAFLSRMQEDSQNTDALQDQSQQSTQDDKMQMKKLYGF